MRIPRLTRLTNRPITKILGEYVIRTVCFPLGINIVRKEMFDLNISVFLSSTYTVHPGYHTSELTRYVSHGVETLSVIVFGEYDEI